MYLFFSYCTNVQMLITLTFITSFNLSFASLLKRRIFIFTLFILFFFVFLQLLIQVKNYEAELIFVLIYMQIVRD